jgi:hypothetical protein
MRRLISILMHSNYGGRIISISLLVQYDACFYYILLVDFLCIRIYIYIYMYLESCKPTKDTFDDLIKPKC